MVAEKAGTLPAPLAPTPMAVLLLVHAKVEPVGELMNEVIGTSVPGHKVSLTGKITVGTGLTVMVYEAGFPTQPFKVAVTETVPEIGVSPALVEVNAAMLPVPDAPKPILVLVLLQAKVAPAGLLVKLAAGTTAPTQTDCAAGTVVVGAG